MSVPLGVIAYSASGASTRTDLKRLNAAKQPKAPKPEKPSKKAKASLDDEHKPATRRFHQVFAGKGKGLNKYPSLDFAANAHPAFPAPRPKHIPILIPDYNPFCDQSLPPESITPDLVYFDEASTASSPSPSTTTFPGCVQHIKTVTPAKRHPRHVEIVIPDWVQSLSSEPSLLSGQLSIVDTEHYDNLSLTRKMSRSTTSSRTSTLDSSTSPPSISQLYARKGSSAQLSINSSQSSLGGRDEYASASESESQQPDASQTHLPGRAAGASPAAQSSNPATNLSGLVCNVHRTTGKEPPALVGATTTILGDKLFVFGGRRFSRTRPHLTSDLYELDLLHRHWTRIEMKGDVPSPRYFHSVCALGDNMLVCYGGMSPESVAGQEQNNLQDAQVTVMSDVHIFDVPTQTWMKVATAEAPQGRYAHCAAILPSSAVFASAGASVLAIHNNPSGANPNQGSLGVQIDGTGGAEMIVVGGQDSANHYIEQISVFNLRSLKWTSTRPMSGRSCGAYRSVVTPLTTMSAARIGAGPGRPDEEDDDLDEDADEAEAGVSGSPMLIYTNYNFLDVKLELQVRLPDGSLADKPMHGSVSPPGLRFPSGGVIDNNFVVAGTFLTSSKQEFSLWSLDLRTLTWARIDTGSNIFSQGSWNRGVLWNRRNAFVILGNRKRNLVEDYNNRRLNFSNMCIVQLEAFGLYDNPRKTAPTSDYMSISAPPISLTKDTEVSVGGRQFSVAAEELGELALQARELADMDFLAIDGTRLPVNSRLVARRWGPSFNALLRDGSNSHESTDTATLRPNTSILSRNSSITITPSISSGATTLTANTSSSSDPADARALPPTSRPRTLYLPHTVPTLQSLIHYLYTSSLPPLSSHLATPQIFCSLLQLARPYKIDGLLEAVIERLHESLDGRNAAAIFNAAAMGAGGGNGIEFAEEGASSVLPPRTVSLAGLEDLTISGGNSSGVMGMAGRGGGNGGLRINTDVANGINGSRSSTRNTIRHASDAGSGGTATAENTPHNISSGTSFDDTDDDMDIPDSASTANSLGSQVSLANAVRRRREEREMWDGGWSAVIGLQKRGLRGLMEGRRAREKGRSDSTPSGPSGSISGPIGSISGPSGSGVGLGIA